MGIEMEELPSTMSLLALADRCMSEMHNYRRREAHNDQYCLEIFRRAMLQQDDYACAFLQQQLNGIMLGWLYRHPSREMACRIDSEQTYVDQAFTRFWQATAHNQEPQFNTLAAALRYLHMSLNSAILDTLRAYSRSAETPLPGDGSPEEPILEDDYPSDELWNVIQSLLPDEREQRVAYLLFHCGLKPREILRCRPQEFSSVQEIYQLRRNIFARLLRNRDQIHWQLN